MLFPQRNEHRDMLDASGIWRFKPDPDNIGEREEWYRSLDSDICIAVPGSWNEQLETLGLLHYIGAAWYSTTVVVPRAFAGRRVWLRIGSADYAARVWVNRTFVGEHGGGFLPFEFEVTSLVQPGIQATIVVKVSNELSSETIPQGIYPEDFQRENRLCEETYPPSRFDFFPYGGIHRPVMLYATPLTSIETIRVDTSLRSRTESLVRVGVGVTLDGGLSVRGTLLGEGLSTSDEAPVREYGAQLSFDLDNCRLWGPHDPYLYTLRLELRNRDETIDSYSLTIGVREVTISGNKLVLNGEPVYLRGFGKHEDFPVLGKGLCLPLIVKDCNLMKWINANSFRTSHYPYAEEMMSMADRMGFLVIDEVPAVSLDLRHATRGTLESHKKAVRELIDRDYNHPSVIMWALGNEPNLVGDQGYLRDSGRSYWREVFAYARTLDASRPLTVPNCSRAGIDDPVFELSDVLTLNRYFGWYEYPCLLDRAMSVLGQEMDKLYARHGKPVMMTEFGADAVPGLHSIAYRMFTEEYQERLLVAYIRTLRTREYVVGEHVWNFADFRTPQHFRRVLLNMKGVFTRERQPKSAAFTLKALWGESRPEEVPDGEVMSAGGIENGE